jgi:hypothetical protein
MNIPNMEKKELERKLRMLVIFTDGDGQGQATNTTLEEELGEYAMQKVSDIFSQELSKAREEGRREQAELDRTLYGVSFEHIKNADFEKILLEYVDKARREYFSMGMEYFSLIDDSNIYQQKGWKLPKEKAERLQILGEIFNLLKDNK